MATVLTLINHCWIASLLIMGSFAHLALFLLRDLEFNAKESQSCCVLCRILLQKSAIISGLSWVCLWLGFHILGVYIHNDVLTSFGMANSQILLDPFLDRAKFLVDYGTKLGSGIGCLFVDKPFGSMTVGSSAGDYLVFHSVAFSIHVTLLILVKGALDGLGSRLLPDKANAPYGFPCDGPGRGGTCDISSWDAFYLSFFWLLNSNSWLMFGFHWKQIILTTSSKLEPLASNLSKVATYEDSSSYLCGWFRDYLWFNSASLIRGYDCLGTTDLSVWAWTFLLAHLCWSTSFMFLISWRGYWQELIEVIIYMHLKTPMLYDIWSSSLVTPVALSILQARLVGLVHFASGLILTYAAFVWGSTL
jgi:photosystem I P700 chlorophyll a apoprotein A2